MTKFNISTNQNQRCDDKQRNFVDTVDVSKSSCSHSPFRVPEYMWERSADVDPFSVMTAKSSEKPAASGFSSRRKALKDRDNSEDDFLSV